MRCVRLLYQMSLSLREPYLPSSIQDAVFIDAAPSAARPGPTCPWLEDPAARSQAAGIAGTRRSSGVSATACHRALTWRSHRDERASQSCSWPEGACRRGRRLEAAWETLARLGPPTVGCVLCRSHGTRTGG